MCHLAPTDTPTRAEHARAHHAHAHHARAPHARAHHASLQELEAQQKSSAMELEQMSRERSLQITEVVARAVQEQVQANLGHQSAEARQLAE